MSYTDSALFSDNALPIAATATASSYALNVSNGWVIIYNAGTVPMFANIGASAALAEAAVTADVSSFIPPGGVRDFRVPVSATYIAFICRATESAAGIFESIQKV